MSLNSFPTCLTSVYSLVVWKEFQQGDAPMMAHQEVEYPSFLPDEVMKSAALPFFPDYILHPLSLGHLTAARHRHALVWSSK